MDYKKEYEEALERAKAGKPIDEVFPELKESEDERIRKILIHIVKGACCKYGIKYKGDEITEEKLLAYLERQKWQKPFSSYDMAKCFIEGQDYVIRHPEKFRLQKPAEWNEEDEKMRWDLINAFTDKNNSQVDEFMQNRATKADVISWLKSLRPLPKQEWSKEEKGILLECISALQNSSHWLLADKLSSLRPQPKVEWSKEEERYLYNAIEAVKYVYDISEGTNGFKCVEFLKSLRPQPHWKPSEEQMDYLQQAIEEAEMEHLYALQRGLVNLMEELKKLLYNL